MAFQQALSGLNTSAKAIDATSHNVANASTVGFKAGRPQFADIFAASLNGSGVSQIGIGVNLAAVQQQFTQGNITTTNNPLDIAINGAGFFRMDHNGGITYARNGQFHLNKDGYIINDQLMKLTGYPALNGIIVESTPEPLRISTSYLAPQATGTNTSSPYQGVIADLNLDSRSTQPIQPWVDGAAPGSTTPFVPDPQTYNFSTALTIYDSLGNPHTMTYFFRKTANPGEWNVYSSVDGTTNQNLVVGGGPLGTLTFNSLGALVSGSPVAASVNLNNVMTSLGRTNSAVSPLSFNIDFDGTTQFGTQFGVNQLQQDGYAAGNFIGLSISPEGVVLGRYSNGKTFPQGQIVLANFADMNGLQQLGNNQWAETAASGTPLIGAPNTSNLGIVQSLAVEESNVDLTAELINLIIFQRNYQANAQSVKTQDSILQTLVNLR